MTTERKLPENCPAGVTPMRGLTAVLGRSIGENTYVRLGVVGTVCLALLGGVIWLTNLHEHLAVLEYRQNANEEKADLVNKGMVQQIEKLDKKQDQIMDKLDRLNERLSERRP